VRDGRAELVVTFASGGRAEVPLRLRYGADAPWLQPDDELLVLLPVEPPSPLRHAPWVLATLAALAGVAWGRRRKPAVARPRIDARVVAPGVTVVAPLPRTERHVALAGRVFDAHDGAPIAGTRVLLRRRGMESEVTVASATASADGRFTLDVSHAAATDELVTEGALHASVRKTVPRAREVSIALVSRRRAVLDALVRWAAARAPWKERGREPTPAEIAGAAEARDAHVTAWARGVEAAAFGPDAVDARREDEVGRLASIVAQTDPRGDVR
jgi:hypothetical protein